MVYLVSTFMKNKYNEPEFKRNENNGNIWQPLKSLT